MNAAVLVRSYSRLYDFLGLRGEIQAVVPAPNLVNRTRRRSIEPTGLSATTTDAEEIRGMRTCISAKLVDERSSDTMEAFFSLVLFGKVSWSI